jgi:uncharacterized protein
MSIFLKANWEHIIMANYALPPEVLLPYLPKGVTLDLFYGKAFVSLVGFMFKDTKIFNIPIPYLGTFEEVNLRFYVKYIENNTIRRGVVFINETIPYRIVAFIANALYKEHYTTIPTKHKIIENKGIKNINYYWLKNKKWNSIELTSNSETQEMQAGSFEQFIFEHYYGYTKVSESVTEEYKLRHPSWKTYYVIDYKIDCDFAAMYGDDFKMLNSTKPTAVFMAQGSEVAVEWKRNKI